MIPPPPHTGRPRELFLPRPLLTYGAHEKRCHNIPSLFREQETFELSIYWAHYLRVLFCTHFFTNGCPLLMTKQSFTAGSFRDKFALPRRLPGTIGTLKYGYSRIRAIQTGYQSSVCKTSHAWKPTLTSRSWDHVYEREVANFEDTGDEGEVW